MYILSQSKTRLINSDCFREFAVVPGDGNTELHAVDLDSEPILLGVFHEEKHAVEVLEFLQCCLTNEDAKSKCTDIPSAEDAAMKARLCSCDNPLAGADLESMLGRLFK